MKKCEICGGEGWVCENHPFIAWDDGDGCPCGGAGAPCRCNPFALVPPGTEIIAEFSSAEARRN
jgi:hypothetical protein